ncbi:MAG: B12-binding domain-containing radical SAM protein [Proteobacteria bacterium]|nr:B12-binding domain-containing radical SAM protein [Pseudomonadota bacterium]
MTDILLIQPPIRDFYLTAKRTIPYGLACIASSLEREGFTLEIFDGLATSKSRIVDLPEELQYLRSYYPGPDRSPFALFHHFKHFGYSFEHIGSMARDSGAFLVGISSLFTPYLDDALKTAEMVKARHPQCRIVLGGHHPTHLPDSVMDCGAVDFVLRGEGEVSMPLLARSLKENLPLDRIPGIVFRKGDSGLHVEPPAIMEDPDRYPKPAMHLVKHKFYKRAEKGSCVIAASRGCPMRCTYCSVGASSYLTYRRRTVASVLDEIETAVNQYDVRFVDFEDENLSLDRKWFRALLDGIVRRFGGEGLELRAMNGLLPSSLDEETLLKMKSAGFKTLNLSLCSTSSAQLQRFNRPDVGHAFDRVLQWAGKLGLDAVGYIIAGGPYQDPEDTLSDLLYLAERRVLAGVSIFYPAPGSRDYRNCRDRGLLPDGFSSMRSTALPLSHTTTRQESATLLRLGRILNFMKYLADGASGGDMTDRTAIQTDKLDQRTGIGLRLLKVFLQDGGIRGMLPEGEIFEHDVSTDLTRRFIDGLKPIDVQGKNGRRLAFSSYASYRL